jgi:outer membrane lipoprotein-sorting protein
VQGDARSRRFFCPAAEAGRFTPPAQSCDLAQRGIFRRVAIAYILRMNRRTLLIAPLALALVPRAALAEKLPLGTLSKYLNGLTTAEAEFTQVNSDGSVSTGRIVIKRPGRVRFEYAPPDKSLVLASAGQVAVFDGKSNQPPEQYPLKRTPLNLILAENIDLGRAKMVVGHKADATSTSVVAQDPEHPEYGTIELKFTADPVELRQWIITDDLGKQTTVILGALKKGGDYGTSLFSITREMEKRGL